MTDKKILPLLTVAVLLTYIANCALWFETGARVGENRQLALRAGDTQLVQQICDSVRNQTWQVPMLTCGQAENATGLEYLCNQAGSSCWVEQDGRQPVDTLKQLCSTPNSGCTLDKE